MSEQENLEHRFQSLEKAWEELSDKIGRLHETRDNETRTDERDRLKKEIDKLELERTATEADWLSTEQEWKKPELIRTAHEQERKHSYGEAFKTWRQVQLLDPDDDSAAKAIRSLEPKIQQLNQLNVYQAQLAARFPEIESVFLEVMTRLNEIKKSGAMDDPALAVIRSFIEGTKSAEELIADWSDLPPFSVAPTDEPNYELLVDGLKKGNIALFLGSDTPHLLNPSVPAPEVVIDELAKAADYKNFTGSLAKIAEYYQITEYRRWRLTEKLYELITIDLPQIPLYRILANIKPPLLIIYACYDSFLEQAFKRAEKKYVIISPVVDSVPNYERGKLFVQYSDRDTPEPACLEQQLSSLDPMKAGYSIIYKMRGHYDPESDLVGQHRDILTLSEKNYFGFARYMDKLIPSYLGNQLQGRELYFLGYAPKSWEYRLLANAILDKQPYKDDSNFTAIVGETDQFEQAFWKSRNVQTYQIELGDFVQRLEEAGF